MMLKLHVPSIREMDYRQQLLAQPQTMAYNAGLPFEADGYDAKTGCIDFPRTDWRYWRSMWLWNEPSRYSAYLQRTEDGIFVGEACYYYDMESQLHGVGVIIEAQHRNRGYGAQALELIAQRAFMQPEVECLFMDLPADRDFAIRMARNAHWKIEFFGGVCRATRTR